MLSRFPAESKTTIPSFVENTVDQTRVTQKAETISHQLSSVCQELDQLKNQMMTLSVHTEEKPELDTANSDVNPHLIQLIREELKQDIQTIIKQQIQLALDEYEAKRLKPLLAQLASEIEDNVKAHFEAKRPKEVRWKSPPFSTKSRTPSPNKAPSPCPPPDAKDPDADVHALLLKLRAKLSQKDKLVKELEQSKRTYTKPTLSSQLKKK